MLPASAAASYARYAASNFLPYRSCRSGTSDGLKSVQWASSCKRFINRSGIHTAVLRSWARRRSSPVFFRNSKKSSMSRCQYSRDTAAAARAVDGDGDVVLDFEEGDDALALDPGLFNHRARGAHRCPVDAQPSGVLKQLRAVFVLVENGVQVVRHRGEEAGGELRQSKPRVVERRRGGRVVHRRHHLIKLNSVALAVLGRLFRECHAHGDAHPKYLRRFQQFACCMLFRQVVGLERLEPQVFKLPVALEHERIGERAKVKLRHPLVKLPELHSAGNRADKRRALRLLQLLVVLYRAKDVAVHVLQQQPRRDKTVRRVALYHRAHHHDEHGVDFFGFDAVVQLLAHAADDGRPVDDPLKPLRGADERAGKLGLAKVLLTPVALDDDELVFLYLFGDFGLFFLAGFGVLVAVDDVVLGDGKVAALHERVLHQILDVLDRGDKRRVAELGIDGIDDDARNVDRVRFVAVAEHGGKSFLYCNSDLARIKIRYLAVALFNLFRDSHAEVPVYPPEGLLFYKAIPKR